MGTLGLVTMAPGDGLAVTPAMLTTHAAHLDGFATELGTAAGAGRVVEMGNEAYGVLCQGLAVAMNVLDGFVVRGVESAVTSMQDTAGRVRPAAQRYQSTDEAGSASFDGLRGGQ